ncbi:nucleolin-like [Zingiber officinale]|uniref:nucleolin-like n=1 Tax=Zingiber officinale TaxID=94328 RepID=UPI001C4B59C7|nr:nucleolin-like [Zingiber officinale]
MVGGGSRKDDGSLKISNTNVFAALETLKKKKKSDKNSKSKGSSKSQAKKPEPQVFWSPTPLTSKSWADVDDDDDYFATTAPPLPVWGSSQQHHKEAEPAFEEESESEDDDVDHGDEDDDEEHEHEPEVTVEHAPIIEKPTVPVPAPGQLSKRELKKKEMAELDALLHELGISGKETNGAQDETEGSKQLQQNDDDGEKKEHTVASSESKNPKKKKHKKEKSSKEAKEQEEQQLPGLDTSNKGPEEVVAADPGGDTSGVDVERIKKMASVRKKKTGKEMDTSAKVAAVEAAARSARLAAVKKKEKSHYNQQPAR